MRRVLIPSDNRDFVSHLAAAYGRRGWETVVGVSNFDLHGAHYDLVHLQWPEELSGSGPAWVPPSMERVAAIARSLDRWKEDGSRLLLTVHNLYPHGRHRDPQCKALLEACYERVPVLCHFTEASRRIVTSEFPIAAARQNIVTGFFGYDGLLPPQREPAKARRALGIAEGEFVILVFGMLREWAEVVLIRDAFDAARVPTKRLLMAGRYMEFGPVWQQRWRRWTWARWLARRRAVVVAGFVPDAEVSLLMEAADVLIVPRGTSLNSGLVALAASFGKLFIAPDCASFPELVAGTSNPLYQPGDAASLAVAIEQAATLDADAVAKENFALANGWSWDRIVESGLDAVGLQ